MIINELNEFLEIPQYTLNTNKKRKKFLKVLEKLFEHHSQNSTFVKNILMSLAYDPITIKSINDFPFFPVGIFKELELKSISDQEIVKTLTSSGTSGQKVSKIFLDAVTSRLQTKALASIVSSYIGNKRIPMLIIDSDKVLKDRKMFSARAAGILGLSNFGRNHLYVLDEEMRLKKEMLSDFLNKFGNEPILLFGFTFMVWMHFIEVLKREGLEIDLSQGILIHSGGWKKLESLAVDNKEFKSTLKKYTNITKVYNFYGMVEQVGSIYMECEEGYYHTSNFSEIIIRDYNTFRPLSLNKEGIIQTISIFPLSYPGNSILTEDRGLVLGFDNCKCGRKGTYFKVLGRIPKAELRGCSDTYAESIS